MQERTDLDLIDTHAHLDIPPLGGQEEEIVSRARDAGVTQIITVGVDLESSEKAVELASRFHNVYASIGVHPHDAKRVGDPEYDRLIDLSAHEKVVAWGEIGLDYAKNYSPPSVQKRCFVRQLHMALELGLPVIVHDRDAHDDVLEILEGEVKGKIRGVVHCFSGDKGIARRVLDLGFMISVTGVVTFPKADQLKEVVRYVPLERMFLETDSPYLTPVPYRGKPNEPARVFYVAKEVAGLKGVSIEEVARCTSKNARDFFNLSTP